MNSKVWDVKIMNFLEEIDPDEMVRPRLKGVPPCSPVTHSLSLPPHHRVQNIVSSLKDNQSNFFLRTSSVAQDPLLEFR